MKTSFPTLLAVAFVAGLVGAGINHVCSSIEATQQSSSTGQTLVDLSRAIESEKQRTGSYPESIAEIKVPDSGGDFSAQILKEVIYFKTEKGYIAFAGCPKVAYIHPDVSAQYQ